MERIFDAIRFYFFSGWNYEEINCLLSAQYDFHIGLRQLKRILKKLGLARRKEYSDILDVASFIDNEIQLSGRLHGYRWMHNKCIQRGIRAPRESISSLMKLLDPIGVEARRKGRLVRRRYSNPGPNFLWHLDSYDKIKPYGFCVNGCIDGFSRNILWLKVFTTNNDPRVIGGYFLKVVKNLGGCPRRIRADEGTENGHVEAMQTLFRGEDDISFQSGTSKLNQRIEAWWGMLRKECGQYWMDLFKSLADDGLYDGVYVDRNLLQFCFMDMMQVS